MAVLTGRALVCWPASRLDRKRKLLQITIPDVYLTPAAIGYLTQMVLALALTAYLVYRLRTTGRRTQNIRPHTYQAKY